MLLAQGSSVVLAQWDYATVFYRSGALRIVAHSYRPAGAGPFPLVIYNHGARTGRERTEQAFPEIARLLTDAGYAVLVPERRGFGKSEGLTLAEDVGGGYRGPKLVQRIQAEADDVLAAVEYVKNDPSVDTRRIAIMGYSLGGMVTLSATSRTNTFVAAINPAGGALNWNQYPVLQKALLDAAGKIRVPLLSMVAENDATTAAARGVHGAAQAHGTPAQLIIYPPFTPSLPFPGNAPGHALFTLEGIGIWGRDVVAFLDTHLSR